MELFCANSQEVLLELEAAIEEHSLYDVLRCFCEATNHGMDLTDPLPSSVRNLNFIAAHCGKRLIFDHLFLRIFFRFFVSKIFFYDFQTKKPERKRNTASVLSLFTGAIKKKDKRGRYNAGAFAILTISTFSSTSYFLSFVLSIALATIAFANRETEMECFDEVSNFWAMHCPHFSSKRESPSLVLFSVIKSPGR